MLPFVREAAMPGLRSVLLVVALCSLGGLIADGQSPPPAAAPPLLRDVRPLAAAVLRRDLPRIRQLVDAGADPDERDAQGMSPWMWAVNFQDNEALTLLLSRVPSISGTDVVGRRRLAMAASLNNVIAARALLDKGVPVDSPAVDGATPLLIAAESGYTTLMEILLAAGARPNAQDQHGDTPLMAAARIGSIDAARLLLRTRADPNQRDHASRTALHWAARSGRVDMVRLLLDAGANVDVVDDTGRTPMAYASEKSQAAVSSALRAKGARETPATAIPGASTPREAVEKALPLLLRGWQTWGEHETCGACHHRLMIDRVVPLAAERGFAAARSLADEQAQSLARNAAASEPRLREQLSNESALLSSAFGISGDGMSGDALNLNAILELGVARSTALETRALLLARKQLLDGRWRNGLPRVPILSSDFTTTAVAARTIAAYGSALDAAELGERVARAKQWLLANRPATTDDKASRLLGLRWTHADEEAIKSAADLLKSEQHDDGSWSQLPGVNGDAYATGMVLVALRWGIALPTTDPAFERGVKFLLQTQETDGSWFVPKRAAASNSYFESGFPHGKFQFISYAGSCWATMALLYAMAPSSGAPGLVPGAEYSTGANLPATNVKADGTIFVPDAARQVRAVIVLVESWPGADRGLYDPSGRKLDDVEVARLSGSVEGAIHDPRGGNAEHGDLAIGRFRDQSWRRVSETCACALLHLRLGTIRPEATAGQPANDIVIRNDTGEVAAHELFAGATQNASWLPDEMTARGWQKVVAGVK
jgi:N-acyl-D-amino-acid deacylase